MKLTYCDINYFAAGVHARICVPPEARLKSSGKFTPATTVQLPALKGKGLNLARDMTQAVHGPLDLHTRNIMAYLMIGSVVKRIDFLDKYFSIVYVSGFLFLNVNKSVSAGS